MEATAKDFQKFIDKQTGKYNIFYLVWTLESILGPTFEMVDWGERVGWGIAVKA